LMFHRPEHRIIGKPLRSCGVEAPRAGCTASGGDTGAGDRHTSPVSLQDNCGG
jgi:hypothetical protein